MTTGKIQSDLTVRGGVANVPLQDLPTKPPRHQPDTPRTKKIVQPKPDYQPVSAVKPAPIENIPPAKPATADEPTATAAAQEEPPPAEPETASQD